MCTQKNIFHLLCFVLALAGCATTASIKRGDLGESPYRNVVILGEHVSNTIAQQYANEYNARVLYSVPTSNFLSDAVSSSVRGVIGPSRAMRDLILELRSINNTSGDWAFIIPRTVERYFLVTLRNMEDSAIMNAHGKIVLPEFSDNRALELEVARVFGDEFKVVYE